MSLRFHEIEEANHRVLNPISEAQLMRMGEAIYLQAGMRLLDLACGKGEMLSRWAQTFGIHGVGVDLSSVFLDAARQRAETLRVSDSVTFVESDAATYEAETGAFDVVSCLGATWIGGGLLGTLKLMLPALKPGGMLLVGEVFWNEEPTDAVYDALGYRRDDYCTLPGMLTRFKAGGVELVEMAIANHDSFDQYYSMHWMANSDFLRANPNDPDAAALRKWNEHNQKLYFDYGRRYIGWGLFALRVVE